MTQEPNSCDEPEPGTGTVARSLFPAGPADGRSFVDRRKETKRLTDDVLAGRHTWFDSPARYGVTTLLQRMHSDMRHWRDPRIASFDCHLNAAHDARSCCEAMLECAGQLVSQTIRRPNVETTTVAGLFPDVTTELYLDDKLLQTIRFDAGKDPLATLVRVVGRLDSIAHEYGCRAVFVVRDMQQLPALRERETLLTVLGDLIDSSRNITWLFHGQNHHTMQRLFLDREATLHGRCARFTLRPINSSVYSQFLADAAQTQWHCFIGRKATAMILALTDRHPYWINQLCRRLWSSDLPPVIQDVVNEWRALVNQHRYITSREMEHLSPNQRAVLKCLAETPTDQPRARRFVSRTRVSSASVGQALKILAERDLVRLDPDGAWTVADPVMQWSLHPREDIVDSIYEKRPEMRL